MEVFTQETRLFRVYAQYHQTDYRYLATSHVIMRRFLQYFVIILLHSWLVWSLARVFTKLSRPCNVPHIVASRLQERHGSHLSCIMTVVHVKNNNNDTRRWVIRHSKLPTPAFWKVEFTAYFRIRLIVVTRAEGLSVNSGKKRTTRQPEQSAILNDSQQYFWIISIGGGHESAAFGITAKRVNWIDDDTVKNVSKTKRTRLRRRGWGMKMR